MEAAVLIVILIAAVVVLGMTLRVLVTAVRQSRRGQVPTEQQRSQIMLLGGAGLALVLLALLTPTFF